MDLMEKLEQSIGAINSRYDMSSRDTREIIKSMSGPIDGVYKGFRYGYLQGMKAAEAKLKERPAHEPKYKNELRQAIYYHASHTKNVFMLQYLLQIADIFRRRYDDEEYKSVTNLENYQASVICDILQCQDENRARNARTFLSSYASNSGSRKAGAIS